MPSAKGSAFSSPSPPVSGDRTLAFHYDPGSLYLAMLFPLLALALTAIAIAWFAFDFATQETRPNVPVILFVVALLATGAGWIAWLVSLGRRLRDESPQVVFDEHGVWWRKGLPQPMPWNEIAGARSLDGQGMRWLVLELAPTSPLYTAYPHGRALIDFANLTPSGGFAFDCLRQLLAYARADRVVDGLPDDSARAAARQAHRSGR